MTARLDSDGIFSLIRERLQGGRALTPHRESKSLTPEMFEWTPRLKPERSGFKPTIPTPPSFAQGLER